MIEYYRDARRTIDRYPRSEHRAQIVADCCRTTDGPAKPTRPIFRIGQRVKHGAWTDCYGNLHDQTSGVVVGLEIHPQLWSPFVRVKVLKDCGGMEISNQNAWQYA